MDKACKFSSIADHCISNFILFIEIHIGTFGFNYLCVRVCGIIYGYQLLD